MLSLIFYVFQFFPFVKWFGIGFSSDVQPVYLLVDSALLIIYSIHGNLIITKEIKNLSMALIGGLFIGLISTVIVSGFTLEGVPRFIVTYIGIIINAATAFNVLCHDGGIDERFIKIAICVYLLVGMAQRFVNTKFLYKWIANPRTNSFRGVISLTAEPSFYGYICIFFMVLAYDFKKNRMLFEILLLAQIILLATSSVTILYLAIYLIILGIILASKMDVKKMLAAMVGVVVVFAAVYRWLSVYHPSSRLLYFINILTAGGGTQNMLFQLQNDGSSVMRFNDIAICIEGFFNYLGFPHGFSAKKINSGYGSLIYTMGWIGFAVIVIVFKILKNHYNKDPFAKAIPLSLSVVLFSGIQLSLPIFSFLIAYCCYNSYSEINN